MDRQLSQRKRARIVIVGGGFAGAYCAQALERRLGSGEAEVVLLDRRNYFVFYPLLVEAGSGSVEARHAVVSIRSFLGRARFLMAEVTGFDPELKQVHYRLPGSEALERLSYDHLVLALGSVTRLPPVPGLAEHGYEMKGMPDAVRMRDHAIEQLERADASRDPEARRRALHFVVVGANFTGVEVAGELQAVLDRACRGRYPGLRDESRITLVELGDRVLAAVDNDLSAYALHELERRGIRVELRHTLTRIEVERALLDDGRELATETVIWCAGIAPSPLVAALPVPTDERGWVKCRRDLRVEGLDDVWAIGDAAVIRDAAGHPYPATAQHAVRQGRHLASNLARALRGRPTLPCDIRSPGSLAALGHHTAVAKVFGVKLSGFAAWFVWRSVYLLKMPGTARRVRVALDWTLDLLLPRELVQLGVVDAGARPRRAQDAAAVRRPAA